MAYSKTEKNIQHIAEPVIKAAGCSLYDVEYVKEGGIWFLRIYIDNEDENVSLDTCETVSRALSEVLDREDPITDAYYLEVSSPGIERKLKTPEHFMRYLGSVIDVGLYRAVSGAKQLTGVLKEYKDGILVLETENGSMEIPQKETTVVHLHFDF